MSADLTVPAWLETSVRTWRERLHLEPWRIELALALCVNDDPSTQALCEQYPDTNTAVLTFRADVADTPDWHDTIIHELLHVAHARIDHAVERAILPELPAAAQQLAREVYHQQVESGIALLANTLYRATVAIDSPEEQREALAAYAHAAWSGWMAYLFSNGTPHPDGTWTMPAWAVARWTRQLNTPYADLPEEEKASDRDEADTMIGIFTGHTMAKEAPAA